MACLLVYLKLLLKSFFLNKPVSVTNGPKRAEIHMPIRGLMWSTAHFSGEKKKVHPNMNVKAGVPSQVVPDLDLGVKSYFAPDQF